MSEEMLLVCPSCLSEVLVTSTSMADLKWREWEGVVVVKVEHRGHDAQGPFPSFLWEPEYRSVTVDRLVDTLLAETGCVVAKQVRP
jgi:hypothetical protein